MQCFLTILPRVTHTCTFSNVSQPLAPGQTESCDKGINSVIESVPPRVCDNIRDLNCMPLLKWRSPIISSLQWIAMIVHRRCQFRIGLQIRIKPAECDNAHNTMRVLRALRAVHAVHCSKHADFRLSMKSRSVFSVQCVPRGIYSYT